MRGGLRGDLPVVAFTGVLALLLLGPALGPGYVLTYDMVWVPELTMRPGFLGLGTALARAVPSDAVVAALDLLLPGMLLQKLVLLCLLVAGGVGAARLAPPDVLAARLWAAALWTWNPFVVERLVLGHWPVLVGYAALPWVVLATSARRRGEPAPRLWALLVVGSLSASAGLVTGIVALALGLRGRRGTRRADAVLLLGILAANAPWLVGGLLRAGDAVGGASTTAPFAISGSAGLPAPVVALGLGGVWNVDVAAPRGTLAALAALLLLAALAVAGARTWWRVAGSRDAAALTACWALGLAIAVVGWAVPAAPAALAAVPGGGLLRDGGRTLASCAPALAAVTSYGVARLVRERRGIEIAGWALAAALAPVALLPGAAWGVDGRLAPAQYPADWAVAREAVAASDSPGDVLVLPLNAYRAPAWNGGRPVLDPLGRYLPRDAVVADDLVVSGEVVPGEDPRVDAVAAAIGRADPDARAAGLAALGIGLVATDRSSPGDAPDVAGALVHRSAGLEVVALDTGPDRTVEPATGTGQVVAVAAAWAVWLACLLATPVVLLASSAARRRRCDTDARG